MNDDSGPMHRLFLGCPVPEYAAQDLADWAREEWGAKGARLVPIENLHLTVLFFGSSTPETKDRLEALVRRTEWLPLECRVKYARRMTRTALVADLAVPIAQVRELEARLRDPFDPLGQMSRIPAKPPGRLRFHITVARVKPGWSSAVSQEEPDLPRFALDRLVLYESAPGQEGSSYKILATAGSND